MVASGAKVTSLRRGVSEVADIMFHARSAVQAYRGDPNTRKDEVAEKVLRNLEADAGDRVSVALHRLRPALTELSLFYLIQAVDLAKSRRDIVRETIRLADEYHRFATSARELAEFARGKTSISLWSVLPKLVEELDQQARFYDEQPRKLQINHKLANDSAEDLIAIRHFSRRLRNEFRINLSLAARKEAVQWLIEAALDRSISNRRVAEALREPRRRVVGH
jgi:hypothetical protein